MDLALPGMKAKIVAIDEPTRSVRAYLDPFYVFVLY
jgi:hypothetical protein